MALGFNNLDGGKFITWAIGRGGPRKSRFFWAQINNRYINSYYQAKRGMGEKSEAMEVSKEWGK